MPDARQRHRPPQDPDDIGRRRIPTTSAIILLIAGVGVARVVASVTRNQSVDRASQVAEGSADARFARDMPAHPTPAVEMSMMVRHRASPPMSSAGRWAAPARGRWTMLTRVRRSSTPRRGHGGPGEH